MQALDLANMEKHAMALTIVGTKARDHVRTSMQLYSQGNAGFCDKGVKPRMGVIDDRNFLAQKHADLNELLTRQF